MRPNSLDVAWSRAYAKQGLSDLNVRQTLATGFEVCHGLHYLQMAAEKICKAHMCMLQGHQVVNAKKSHQVIAKHLRLLANDFPRKHPDKEIRESTIRAVRRFAKAIELLAPAVHQAHTREDNCEYPWQSKTGVQIPCEYKFPQFDGVERFLVPVIRLLEQSAREILASL